MCSTYTCFEVKRFSTAFRSRKRKKLFPQNLPCHRNGDTPKQQEALLHQLFNHSEGGVEACVLVNSGACVVTSTTPEIENSQAVNVGCELKHIV